MTLRSFPSYAFSLQYAAGKFFNRAPKPRTRLLTQLKLLREVLFNKPADTVPRQALPVQPLTRAALLAAPDDSVFRLGHSSLLLKLDGRFWLTDPVFARRASPLSWLGPARFHPAPISIEELPPIEAVILSHNHYDHLDRDAILRLAGKTGHFLAPLGVGRLLRDWGVAADKVQEMDWWQSKTLGGLRFICAPAQHFSGRGLFDVDKTLWCSWVMLGAQLRVYFSGDSGYFDGFREIGNSFGPFDMVFLETGAYDARWAYVHMLPAQTLQACRDLGGRCLLPIHNGTFDLAMHPWYEPFESILELARAQGIALSTPAMGERVDLHHPHAGRSWWRELAPDHASVDGVHNGVTA